MEATKEIKIANDVRKLFKGKTTKEIREILQIIALSAFCCTCSNESIPLGSEGFEESENMIAAQLSHAVEYKLRDHIDLLNQQSYGVQEVKREESTT